MGIHRAERSLEIDAAPPQCFEAITDYETFAEWQDAVKSAEVVERRPDGAVVDFAVDAKFREVTYRLDYHHEPPGRVWWEFVHGKGVEHVEGEFTFEPAKGGTLATYRLGIDPGVPVPGLIVRRLNGLVMKRSVEDLRDEVLRRAGR